MSFKNKWQKKQLSNFIEIDPIEKLKKRTIMKKVSMSDIQPFNRKIENYTISKYNGGSKFRNSDVLLARITPCLENGKTAYVDVLDEEEIGFGSTEFIVLRNINSESISKYVYYLAISPNFRNIAIKSMTGTSGRQRVQIDILKNKLFFVPKIEEQKQIAAILSSLDDKIELNNRINKNLETMAQAIFKHWFIDFEFPNKNGEPYKSSGGEMVDSELGAVPKEWVVIPFKEIIKISGGKRPKEKKNERNKIFNIPVIGASSVMGYVSEILYIEPILVIGRVGTHGIVQRIKEKSWPSDNTLVIQSEYYEYTYQILKNIDYQSLNIGSTQPLITQTDIKKYKIVFPKNNLLRDFEKRIGCLFQLINKNEEENKILSRIRDKLLPKLLSGEIRVLIDNNKKGDE